jgi:hypothetical protein
MKTKNIPLNRSTISEHPLLAKAALFLSITLLLHAAYVTCNSCGGSGHTMDACGGCGGDGVVTSYDWVWGNCGGCGGSGANSAGGVCNGCGGSGSGYEYVEKNDPCSGCNETGWVTNQCGGCQGAGTVWEPDP